MVTFYAIINKAILIPRLIIAQLNIFIDKLFGRKVIMFHLSIAGQIPYILPLKEALDESSIEKSYYLAQEMPLNERSIELLPLGINRFKTMSLAGAQHLNGIDVFVSATQWVRTPMKSKLNICIFHGQPAKARTFQPDLIKNFNTLFLLGPLQRSLYEEFAEAYPDIANRIKTFNVGYPKSDGLINGKYSRNEMLSDLKLDLSQKTVLYAPAFDDGGSLHMYGVKVVQKLVELDVNVLVKLHPMNYDNQYSKIFTGGVNWPERLKYFDKYANFRHVPSHFIEPLLIASDVMITDVSSVALEFMLLDRPVVYIHASDFYEKTLISQEYNLNPEINPEKVLTDIRFNAGRSAGTVVEDLEKLQEAVLYALANPNELSSKRKAIAEQLLYNPGKGAMVAAKVIEDLLGANTAKI